MSENKICITAIDLSEKMGLSLSTIRNITKKGKIPYIRVGRRILYPVTEIENWLRQKNVSTTSTSKDGDGIEP